MTPQIKLGNKLIGDGNPAFLIAEVAQAHDGSLGTAHAFIDLIADSGFDAVKFQTHIASAESTLDEKFRVKFSRQDSARYAYWERMEFSYDQWVGLAQHAKEREVIFLSSAFSIEAVELLTQIGMAAWKVGSGEFRSKELIKAMLVTGKPVLLSTGLCHWDELDQAIKGVQNVNGQFALFQCTSLYPTPLNKVGLNVIDQLRERYNCVVGLSDHSGTIWPSLAALARGSNMIEVHVTMHRGAFGPDVIASLTPEDLKLVATARDKFSKILSHPVNKDLLVKELKTTRELFTKSIAPSRDLKAGEIIEEGMLTLKKPGTGIPSAEMGGLYGLRLRCDVASDSLLKYSDLQTKS